MRITHNGRTGFAQLLSHDTINIVWTDGWAWTATVGWTSWIKWMIS